LIIDCKKNDAFIYVLLTWKGPLSSAYSAAKMRRALKERL